MPKKHQIRAGDIYFPPGSNNREPFIIIDVREDLADWRYLFPTGDTTIRKSWNWGSWDWDRATFVTNVIASDYWREWIEIFEKKRQK